MAKPDKKAPPKKSDKKDEDDWKDGDDFKFKDSPKKGDKPKPGDKSDEKKGKGRLLNEDDLKGKDESDQDGPPSDGEPGEPGEDGDEEGDDGDFEESESDIDDARTDTLGSIRGETENHKPEGKGNAKMKAEPHESGKGTRLHFHDDVNADIPGDADYQHHVTEHSKHVAGFHINRESDPDRAEAHRQAANVHARIGNALHAGGDTAPRKDQPLPMDPMGMGGVPGMDPNNPFGSDEWVDGESALFPDVQEESPGEDLAGQEEPAKPDMIQNVPGRDSMIEAQRMGKPAPPKLVFGSPKGGQKPMPPKGAGKGKPPPPKGKTKKPFGKSFVISKAQRSVKLGYTW